MENWEWNVQHSEELRIQSRTQLRSWQTIPLNDLVPPDAARIFRRSNSGDDLQLVPSCEEAGGVFSGPLGKAEGFIRICGVVFLGMSISLHNGKKALEHFLTGESCFVVFDWVFLLFRKFLRCCKPSRKVATGTVFLSTNPPRNQRLTDFLAGIAGFSITQFSF